VSFESSRKKDATMTEPDLARLAGIGNRHGLEIVLPTSR
jgi:hypothetical protein